MKVGDFDLMGNLQLFSVGFFFFQLKAEVECVSFPQMFHVVGRSHWPHYGWDKHGKKIHPGNSQELCNAVPQEITLTDSETCPDLWNKISARVILTNSWKSEHVPSLPCSSFHSSLCPNIPKAVPSPAPLSNVPSLRTDSALWRHPRCSLQQSAC